MADRLDVAARLAEGGPSVVTVGDYVWACHLLGYQNPDLTLHAAQVRDWYGSEDGLDLRALEADRAALAATATAADSARQLQERQLDALAGVWAGRGGDASREFLRRHGDASAALVAAVREAVDALGALRDGLWRAVDEKVAAAVAIDDRRQAERAQWLAATQVVATGAGDRVTADELVDQHVKPFVDNDIRLDWLQSMQRAMSAVSAAFDAATAAITGEPLAAFEVPGDLGPSSMSPPPTVASPAEAGGTTPAACPAPAGGPGPVAWPSPAPPAAVPAMTPTPAYAAAPDPLAAPVPAVPAPATAPAAATPAMPALPSLGEMGGGLPGGAGGLAGLGSQLADVIGGLFNRPDDALPDPPELQDDTVDDPVPGGDDDAESVSEDEEDDDEVGDEGEEGDDESDSEATDAVDADKSDTEPVDGCADEDVVDVAPHTDPAPTPPPAPLPTAEQPMVQQPPSPEPVGAETPCEIAADELPQAGP